MLIPNPSGVLMMPAGLRQSSRNQNWSKLGGFDRQPEPRLSSHALSSLSQRAILPHARRFAAGGPCIKAVSAIAPDNGFSALGNAPCALRQGKSVSTDVSREFAESE